MHTRESWLDTENDSAALSLSPDFASGRRYFGIKTLSTTMMTPLLWITS
jgi:hypothetical protein